MSDSEPPDRPPSTTGLPSYPPPTSESGPMPRPEQPPAVRTAVRLMYAGAALSVLSLVVTLATAASLKTHLRNQARAQGNVTASQFELVYHVAIVSAAVGSLVAVALWLWMAWKNGQGRSWARVVATILGGINLLSSIGTVVTRRALLVSEVLTVVDLVLAAVILVLLWRKESTDFFAAA